VVTTNLCSGEKSALTDWPIDQIAQAVEPNATQRAALEALRTATGQALDILKSACPTDLPSTPTGRLESMRQRLDVMLAAVRTVRPALETFYHSLNDEQKARFNALGPDENPDQQQAQRDLAAMCSERAAGVTALPVDRIEAAVRPTDVQRIQLASLRDAIAGAVSLLKTDCPAYQALTPIGRVEAMEQRLDAMMRAVRMVQEPLSKFYGSLSDEQKERFNRLSPAQQS
jgi:ABC-type transporter MlaC component